ncbi:MAG: hypothetical protein ACRDJH_06575 [Thermomicrobiales bacterium]
MQRVLDMGHGRGRLALAVRRARLGCLLVWRRFSPPAEEIAARAERLVDREGALAELEERRIAAEEYHWAVAGERRGEVGR